MGLLSSLFGRTSSEKPAATAEISANQISPECQGAVKKSIHDEMEETGMGAAKLAAQEYLTGKISKDVALVTEGKCTVLPKQIVGMLPNVVASR